MARMRIRFNLDDKTLFSARLRGKGTRDSRIVYAMGMYYREVQQQLEKKFGASYYVTEVEKMTPEQVIRAAQKYLPKMV